MPDRGEFKDEQPTRADSPQAGPPTTPLGPEPTSFVSAAEPLARGASVGRYLILEVIGEGGMGRVYKAYDPQLDRKVALKLMLGVGDPLARQRLLREARAMARLSHPNVVAVHDAGEAGDQVFVAMDFVEGATLSHWLREKPRGTTAILETFRKAGAGLEAAHKAGLVHRDFKPANVLLGDDARVCVTDFGLAREAHVPSTEASVPEANVAGDAGVLSRLTQVGVLAGTPHYMAPEQFEGKEADARVDQFAFGVALWEALYTSQPFPAQSTPERIRRVTRGELAQPAEKKGVPRHVHRALEKALAPRPDFRHRSMASLLEALARDTRPGVRWAPLGIALAAVTTLAALGWWRVTNARSRACTESLASFGKVWNQSTRLKALDAYLAALPQSGQAGWARVEVSLTVWNNSWYDAQSAACEGATGALDPQLEGTLACLDGLRSASQVLVTALSNVNQASALAANEAIASLGSPQDCAKRGEGTGPDSAATRQVHALLAESAVFNVLGQGPEANARALEAAQLAAQRGLLADEARAWLTVATARILLSKFEEADEAAVNALVAAERSGDMRLLASAWSERMSHTALFQARFGQALEYGRLSEGALFRTRGDPAIEARLEMARGYVLTQTGNASAAVKSLERAVALYNSQGLQNMQAARALILLANAQRAAGNLSEALATLDRLDAIHARLLPEIHPSIAAAGNARGRVLLSTGNADGALAAHRAALATQEKTQPGANHEKLKTLAMIGEAERAAGQGAAATLSFRSALDQARTLFVPEHPVRCSLERDLGALLLEAGRHAEAAAALTAAQAGPWPPKDKALLWTGLARAQLELGKPAEAARSAQAALALEEAPLARFTFARALLAQKQKPRALEEAAKARASAEAPLAAQIDLWLAAQASAPAAKKKKRK